MTPDEHAAEAAALLDRRLSHPSGTIERDELVKLAQVHATLSLRPGPVRPAEATVTTVPEVTAMPVGAQLLIDRDGDLWAFDAEGRAWCWLSGPGPRRWLHGAPSARADIDSLHGPLVPLPQPGATS